MRETERETNGAEAAIVAVLILGISLNTLGVVLVALRGAGWPAFALMLLGLALLLYAVLRLTAAAKRRQDGGGSPR